jgi:cytochrome c oxidase assembly protein Cox11
MISVIGITRKQANEYLLPLSYPNHEKAIFFLAIIKHVKKDIAILLEKETYFARIVEYSYDFGAVKQSLGFKPGDIIKFAYISSNSEHAKLKAISDKAIFLLKQKDIDIVSLANKLNEIPWKFLGFRSPVKLKVCDT